MDDFDPNLADGDRIFGPDLYTVQDTSATTPLLAHLVRNSSSEAVTGTDDYIKVHSTFSTRTVVQGVPSTGVRQVEFNVCARRPNVVIPRPNAAADRIIGDIPVNESYQADITYASSRNAALPATFKTMDLRGVVKRLAMGIAHYSLWGTLDCHDLRGGGNVVVRAISAATDNVAIAPGNVFITKRSADHRYGATDCALIMAVNGEGGTPYTDMLTIDGNGDARLVVYRDAALSRGCYEALRLIAAIYDAAQNGAAFAEAVFNGINAVMTLVAHSDEGGHVRAVMRRCEYALPHGAVVFGHSLPDYNGMPSPSGTVASFRNLTLSILIGAAGGSIACDPMTKDASGRAFPTILVDVEGGRENPGDPSDQATWDDQMRLRMQEEWMATAGAWGRNYAYYLARLFNFSGSTDLAVDAISTRISHGVFVDTHLRRPVAVAYYWVEPTGSCPIRDPLLPATAEDIGPLAVLGERRSVPAFRGGVVEHFGIGEVEIFTLDFRYLRRHPYFVHLTSHARNGLSHIALMSGDAYNFANVGGRGDFEDRLGDGLNTFCWGRLHNMIAAPGELVSTNRYVQFAQETSVVRAATRNHAATRRATHGFGADDFDDLPDVSYSVSSLSMDSIGPLVAHFGNFARARTGAAIAIDQCRGLSNGAQYAGAFTPTVGEPVFRNLPGFRVRDATGQTNTPARHRPPVERNAAETITVDDVAAVPAAGADYNATRVPLVLHNVADRGRRAPRPTQLVSGGGGGGGGSGGGRAGPPRGGGPASGGGGGGGGSGSSGTVSFAPGHSGMITVSTTAAPTGPAGTTLPGSSTVVPPAGPPNPEAQGGSSVPAPPNA
uniref:Coat protein n=1 Tax=Diatom colony associated virus-Like RNA Segment 3 TaxID=1678183 RepID=A0A146J6J9_9VIRU|nr:coat protein [Diatom colony associated virus-Like RNA Segment 3]